MRAFCISFCTILIATAIPFLSCTNAPNNPYDISNTKITLYARSFSGAVGTSNIEDTIGNIVNIGAQCNFWANIDSVKFLQIVQTSTIVKDSIITVNTNVSAMKYSDTLWQSVSFDEMGTKTIAIMAFVKNGNVISDSVRISIYPKTITNHAPAWQKDSINEVSRPGNALIVTLSDKCTDLDGDNLSFSLLSGPPDNDSIANAASNPTYIFAPGQGDTGVFYPRIVATDSKGGFDTLTMVLNIHASGVIDSILPVVKHLIPSGDSITVSSNSYKVSVICKDSSGIASVQCFSGADTVVTGRIDSIWSATITGLVQGIYKTITFTATDMSARANKASLSVFIKYDSTMADVLGPIITKKSGPLTNAITANPNDTLFYTITDQSGVDTVSWTLNSGASTILLPDANNQYTIKAVLSAYHTNKIIITASDKSSAHNKSSDTTILDYNVPPKANDQTLSTKKNTALPFTLTADPIDGDTLSNWKVVSPTVNGDLSGTAPMLTYTPKTGFLGADSLSFTVTDGKNTSNIAKIRINVSDVLVAPIVSIISGNKETCVNVAATFSVSATGSQPIKYQWMKGTAAAPGTSTDSTYTITPLSAADAGSFYCLVSNRISPDAQSQNMTLTVDSPPAISSIIANPATMPVCLGTQVAFTVTATGTSPLVYSWKKNGTAITNGPNAATYTITSVAASDSGQYSCTVSNGCTPAATSANVPLSIKMPPTISAPTANATISKIVGDTVTFTVTASGTGTLTYQWYKGSSAVGTNSSSLPIKPIAFTDSGVYTCAVSNGCGSVTSKVITLTVSSLPSITTQPLSQILYLNQTATFTVVAIGVPQPTYRWEKNGADINGATNASYTISSPGISDSGKYTVAVTNNKGTVISDTARFYAKVKIMSAGTSSDNPFSLFVKTDGTIWACGDNTFGQFGDGTTNSQITPVQIKSITNIQNVAAGATHSLFLKYDGMVWACGNNGSGQLGDGTTTSRTVSVQMINISNVLSIAAGGDHSLILKKDGTVWTCGNNSYGQLGDGTTINHSTPVQVTSIINVQSVAAGTFQCLMLKVDGTLWTCGYNYYGSIGDGTTIDRYFPVQVTTLGNNVKAMSASGAFSLILKNDGTLWTCGYNYCGELGDGTNSDRSTPGQITTISNVQSISAGEQHSLILKADATLWACGSNYYGELGDGSMSNKNTPIQIANMNNVQSIAAGEFHSLILKTDGTVWACGNNSNGQLGDGSTTNRSTPIRISF